MGSCIWSSVLNPFREPLPSRRNQRQEANALAQIKVVLSGLTSFLSICQYRVKIPHNTGRRSRHFRAIELSSQTTPRQAHRILQILV